MFYRTSKENIQKNTSEVFPDPVFSLEISSTNRGAQEEQYDVYLVPTKIIPDERQVVRYVEGAVLVEERELAAAAGPAREPDHHGVVLVAPRLEEEVEHPTRDEPAK